MLKRIRKTKSLTDFNELTRHLPSISAQGNDVTLPQTRAEISRFMAQMGRKGGKIGGKRRLQTMTAEERSEIAKKAARARWKRKS